MRTVYTEQRSPAGAQGRGDNGHGGTITYCVRCAACSTHSELAVPHAGQTCSPVRWTQRDPIDYQDSINLYQFCGNSPLGSTDPDGRDAYVIVRENRHNSMPSWTDHAAIVVATPEGKYVRQDANKGNVSDPRTHDTLAKATEDARTIIGLKTRTYANGETSDDRMLAHIDRLKQGADYGDMWWCSIHVASVVHSGGYDLGDGLTPGSLVVSAARKLGTGIGWLDRMCGLDSGIYFVKLDAGTDRKKGR